MRFAWFKAVSSKITVQPKDIAAAEISLQAENLIYTGEAQKPTVTCPKGMAKTYKKLLQKKGMPKKTVYK